MAPRRSHAELASARRLRGLGHSGLTSVPPDPATRRRSPPSRRPSQTPVVAVADLMPWFSQHPRLPTAAAAHWLHSRTLTAARSLRSASRQSRAPSELAASAWEPSEQEAALRERQLGGWLTGEKPDAQWISSREDPLVPSAEDRQLCIKLTHGVSRLLDTPRACRVRKQSKSQRN